MTDGNAKIGSGEKPRRSSFTGQPSVALSMGRLKVLTGSTALADVAAPLVLPWFGYVLSQSLFLMATMYMAQALIPLISVIWLTPKLARVTAGRLLVWSQEVRVATIGVALFSPLLSGLALNATLIIGSGALGLSSVLAEASLGALISGEREQLTARAGQVQFVQTVMNVLGLPAAGIMVGVLGPSLALVVLLFDSALVGLAARRWTAMNILSGYSTEVLSFGAGFRKLWQMVEIRSLAVQAMLGNFGYTLVMSGFLFYLLAVLRLDSLAVSAIYLVIGVGSMVGTAIPSRLLGRFRRGTIYPLLLAGGFSGVLLLQFNNVWGAAVGESVVALCDTAWVVLSTGVRLELISENDRPLVLTSSRLLSNALIPVGGLVVALGGTATGFAILFGVAAIFKGSEAVFAKVSSIGRLDAGACCAMGAMKASVGKQRGPRKG